MTTSGNFLATLPTWSQSDALRSAQHEGLEVDDRHMQILTVARSFFDTYGFSPSMRPLCKTVMTTLELDISPSLYLNQLFPGSPAKMVAQLAGLPVPKNCL